MDNNHKYYHIACNMYYHFDKSFHLNEFKEKVRILRDWISLVTDAHQDMARYLIHAHDDYQFQQNVC